MTNNSLPEAHPQPVEGDRFEVYHTGGGCMAWRLTVPDSPGLFALVTDEGGTHIPTEPETENLIIGICDIELDAPLLVLETGGRAGLCRRCVDYTEPDGPRPIRQLVENVATHMLLRCAEPEDTSGPGLAGS